MLGVHLVCPAIHAQSSTTGPAHVRWSSYVGGTGNDKVLSMALDDFGHLYVAGRTTDSLLLGNDTTGNSGLTHQRHFGGGASDAFLAKFAPQGAMLWCTYFGGTGDDEAVQVVVSGMDAVYLVGTTDSPDSIATDTLSFQQTPGGGKDFFVARFTDYGLLTGATYFGGQEDEVATGAALDTITGSLVVGGYANGPGAFSGSITPQQAWNAGNDGLLLRFKGTNALLAGTYLGGSGEDRIVQVAAVNGTGAVILGNTNSTTGIATTDALTSNEQGGMDAFLMKVDTNLAVQNGTYFGGTAEDEAFGLALRGNSLAIVGMSTSTQLYTNAQSFQPANAGQGDGFLALLDTSLQLSWSTFLGGAARDTATGVAIDQLGSIYAAGTSASPDLPLSAGNVTDPLATVLDAGDMLHGPADAFLMRFDGDSLAWSRYVGAMGADETHALCMMGYTTAYLGGRTTSDSSFTRNPHQASFGGGVWDGFSMRLDQKFSTPCSGISTCSGGGPDPPLPIYHVCHGDSIMFVAYGGALGYDAEWMWYADGCGVNEDYLTMGDTIVLWPDHNFTLYVRAEGADHVTSCSYAIIIVHEIPQPVISVSDTVCAGTPITVHGTGAETFAWRLNDSVVATGADTSFLAPMTPGTIHVTGAGTNGPACTVEISAPVVVLPAPEVGWHHTNINCAGDPGAIGLFIPDSSQTDSTTLTLAWQPPSVAGPLPDSLPAGLYVATVTDTVVGCSSTDSITILAPPTQILAWQHSNITCGGLPGTITLELDSTIADSTLTIQWAQSGLSGPSADELPAGTYVVTVSDTMGCSRTDSITILLPPSAEVQWQATNPTCAGGTDGMIVMTDPTDADTALLTIAWGDPGLEGPMLTGLAAGSYSVTVSDTMGCSRSDSLVITGPPQLMDSISTTVAFCGQPVGTAQVVTSSNAPGLVIDFGNGPDTLISIGQLAPGNYTVTAKDSAGCQQQLTFNIASVGSIAVNIAEDTVVAEDGTTVLSCTITPAGSGITVHWLPITGLDTPEDPSTDCTVADTTLYIVQAVSAAGCLAFDSVVVVPKFTVPPTIAPPCGNFFLPDHFSPNGDGLNDELCPLGGCITMLDWNIYDRWGAKVFSATGPDACWDGTLNGILLPPGSYAFTLRMERSDGQHVDQTGSITLVR
ncbi:MAG: gliding motility-associated C-terminal domain-containing protein [Acidobacteria bacterium]|nr:gliding motility-associated C-terminal domain-containing protein [Acidobacteriota bacterium]